MYGLLQIASNHTAIQGSQYLVSYLLIQWFEHYEKKEKKKLINAFTKNNRNFSKIFPINLQMAKSIWYRLGDDHVREAFNALFVHWFPKTLLRCKGFAGTFGKVAWYGRDADGQAFSGFKLSSKR